MGEWEALEMNSVSDPLNLKYYGHCSVENCKFRWGIQDIRGYTCRFKSHSIEVNIEAPGKEKSSHRDL